MSLEDALINYTTEELDGTITAEQYGEPAGRITIVDEPANYPADLETGSWYYNAAVYALDNGIMNGTNKGFEPPAPSPAPPCTRLSITWRVSPRLKRPL